MLRYLVRLVVGLAVAGYGVWVAWPLVAPFTAGGDLEAATGAAWQQIRLTGPAQSTLWLGAIALYLAAAVLTVIGHVRASGAYLMAFMAEISLRLLISQQGTAAGADVGARTGAYLSGRIAAIDPAPTAMAAVAILGMIVLALEFWPRPAPRRGRTQPSPSPQQAAA